MEELNIKGLYSIGAISKIVKISTDTLRYYNDIGLLKPALTSEQTGYRYYSDIQVTAILRILELKQYGFSLSTISEILYNKDLPLIDIYKERHAELLGEKQKLQDIIDKLSLLIHQNQEGITMNKTILLVDDAPFMRMMCKDIVTKEGWQIAGEAANGIEAVEKYKELMPDVVLLDIVMPEMNGIEALKGIKEINKDAKVVMCSAMSPAGMLVESLLAGAQDFIGKPFQPEYLVSVINNALTNERVFNHGALKQLFNICADNTSILNQTEINQIISYMLDDGTPLTTDKINQIILNSKSNGKIIHSSIESIINIDKDSGQKASHCTIDGSTHEILMKLDEILKNQESIKNSIAEILAK